MFSFILIELLYEILPTVLDFLSTFCYSTIKFVNISYNIILLFKYKIYLTKIKFLLLFCTYVQFLRINLGIIFDDYFFFLFVIVGLD